MSEYELIEVKDIETEIKDDLAHPEVAELKNPYPISYHERLWAFEKEWKEFVKKEITENIEPWFHLWRGMGAAENSFFRKIHKLAKKHFRGILTDDILIRFQIFVKQLLFGITAFISANKKTELEPILDFVESFCEESFEEIDCWNCDLPQSNMDKLKPYREEDLIEEPPFDKSKNNGYPSWIKFSVGSDNEDEWCELCKNHKLKGNTDDENASKDETTEEY